MSRRCGWSLILHNESEVCVACGSLEDDHDNGVCPRPIPAPDDFSGTDFPQTFIPSIASSPVAPAFCATCFYGMEKHVDGKCPVNVHATPTNPFATRANGSGNASKLASGAHAKRADEKKGTPGRPFVDQRITQEARHARKLERIKRKMIVETVVGKGMSVLDDAMKIRTPVRQGAPERTVAECKDAALRMLSAQLWTLEGRQSDEGLTEEEEARVIKLLAGFNAALPKQAEKPAPKGVDQMTEEELAAVARGEAS